MKNFVTTRSRPKSSCFFFNDTATPEIYTLSLRDALPISLAVSRGVCQRFGCVHLFPDGTRRRLYGVVRPLVVWITVPHGNGNIHTSPSGPFRIERSSFVRASVRSRFARHAHIGSMLPRPSSGLEGGCRNVNRASRYSCHASCARWSRAWSAGCLVRAALRRAYTALRSFSA